MNKKIIAFVVSAFLSVSAMAADQKGQGSKHINVNQATVEELDKGLLGVGPRIAMEIVKHRDQHGPYQDFDDLDKVKPDYHCTSASLRSLAGMGQVRAAM